MGSRETVGAEKGSWGVLPKNPYALKPRTGGIGSASALVYVIMPVSSGNWYLLRHISRF